jgi:hypothetical protein
MRVLVSILFSAVAVFAQDQTTLAPGAQVPENLSIPARLTKTLDTNKCKSGDVVEMRTLEPVLLSHGLVMPEDAKLQGKVLGAASSQNNQPSWIVLVLERAEWKQHSILLHAFVSGQITVKVQASAPSDNAFENATNSANNGQRRHGAAVLSSPGRRPPDHPIRCKTQSFRATKLRNRFITGSTICGLRKLRMGWYSCFPKSRT